MPEEAKILMADKSNMYLTVKACFDESRTRILGTED
jgi:hypothetical protein